ncbi:MAG: hypothetical protein A2X86_04575 [Bdellovibrionales bacterium GWA2_49_15]|nr:MAG: hypothetical protein A2X86_04575 [Bdellovibrionales bacterium GWA2_49_15]
MLESKDNRESVQLLNTAIIKAKEKKIDTGYEERLKEACNRPAVKALGVAVTHLSETQKISRDQAAIQIIETVKELESIWADYVMMEGINNLKNILKAPQTH